ncbi:MAG TPA: tetratricopeptide repeat protein [Vicinamibacterales bacterium]|nr:tetratricopeptide repeat protein [Vicinamibacterales bacterium]
MAKQRRPQPKLSKAQAKPSSTSAAPLLRAPSGGSARLPDTAPPSPPHRPGYSDAVALYERGLEALQRHDYQGAAELLKAVLQQHPDEKELHERVRLYLNICERHAPAREAGPQTIDERLYASTLAINGGKYDQAIVHLRLVRDEDPDNDHALYMLAVAHAQRGEHAEALAHLERAIALNAENRGLAKRDPDLEPLRGHESFRSALDATPLPRSAARRPPIRTRTAR